MNYIPLNADLTKASTDISSEEFLKILSIFCSANFLLKPNAINADNA